VVGQCHAGEGLAASRERVGGGGHGHDGHGAQGLGFDAGIEEVFTGQDGQVAALVAQGLQRAAQGFDSQAQPHRGQGFAQVLQCGGYLGQRVERVHHQRQLDLDPFPQAAGARRAAQGRLHAGARVFQQGLAGRREGGAVAAAVEEPHVELGLQVGDGVAHGRLRAQQARGPSAKAAGIGHGDEHADLVEREGVEH
jgi:hypothetical protein